MNIKAEPRSSLSIERSIQHIVQVVSGAAIIGGAVVLADLRTSNAVIQNELISLKASLEEVKVRGLDLYTGTQASKDLSVIFQKIRDNELRIREVEKDVQDVQREMMKGKH